MTSKNKDLGPLEQLIGKWANVGSLEARGWNMIAFPFDLRPFHYKLMLNHYNETLTFKLADAGVINRGRTGDQDIFAIHYEQKITQIVADSQPKAPGEEEDPNKYIETGEKEIHHEVGHWLNIHNYQTNNLNIARLSTIPHGDSVLAMGQSSQFEGAPYIEDISGLPDEYLTLGSMLSDEYKDPETGEVLDPDTMDDDTRTSFEKKFYLGPYQHYQLHPFEGLFDPVYPNRLLMKENEQATIVKTTQLEVDSALATGGIANSPFVVKNADASQMTSSFWIQELAELDSNGNPKLRLQYSQVVWLDFYHLMPDREKTRWPHISINTLEKVVD